MAEVPQRVLGEDSGAAAAAVAAAAAAAGEGERRVQDLTTVTEMAMAPMLSLSPSLPPPHHHHQKKGS